MVRYDPNVPPNPAAWQALDEEDALMIVERHHHDPGCAHPPAPNPRLHASIHVIVENQIAMRDELPAARTLQRLMAEGLTRHEAVHAIGSVAAQQLYDVLGKRDQGAIPTDYDAALHAISAESWRRSGAGDPDRDESEVGLADHSDGPENLDDVVAGFCVPAPTFPVAALQAAAQARDRINDRLLGLIADTHRAALEGRVDPSNGHIFAMLLLAHFEDARAFDVIADFFSLPESVLDHLVGDFLTEDLGRVLASVCDGRIERLATLVEDRSRDQYVRGAALSAVAALVQRRRVTRDDAADYLRQLFRGRLEQEPSAVWDEAGNLVLDLYIEALFVEVRDAIRQGLIDRYAIAASDIDQTIRDGREMALARLEAKPHYHPVRDVVAETRWWHCFRDDGEARKEANGRIAQHADPDREEHTSPAATVRRTQAKVGRNDPCPCGSGKKYKRCCLQKG